MRRIWRRWRNSIRIRLIAGLLLLLALALATSATITAYMVNGYIFDRSVENLRQDAQRMGALVQSSPQVVNADQFGTVFGPPQGILGLAEDGSISFAIGSSDGPREELVRLTRDVAPYEVVVTQDDVAGVRIITPGMRVGPVSGGRTVEVAEVVLVNDTEIDRREILDFVQKMSLVAGIAMVFVIGLALLVLKVGLRPLARMALTADAIAEGSREDRLPVSELNSETDRLAAAVNRAFDAQADAEARARTFAADASHELRTPVATVSGWLELYRQGGLRGADLDQAIARIEDEMARIRLLVEELGLLASLDTGRPLDRDPLDLVRLAESVVEDAQIIHPDLDLVLEAPPTAEILGDGPRLQQVLRNLVGNAVQHTPAGTRVRLTLHQEADEVRVDVTDNGPGIPAADLPRVFERFWRAEASRSRDYGGSGLGLAIVQAIVKAHGGRVGVVSEVGEGTTVSLHLPVR